MKGLILYFSGSGNTKFIANKIEEEFVKNGCDIENHSIEEKINIKNFEYDYLILGFPKYFEYIPQNFMEYINDNLGMSYKEVKTMIFTTGKDKNKIFFNELEKILLEKKYKVIVTKNFKMPDSFIISKNYRNVKNNDLDRIYQSSSNEIKDTVANFLIENYSKEEINNFKATIMKRLYKFKTKDLYKNSYKFSINSSCDKCNLCVKVCPTRNIEYIGDDIKFRDNCIMCCRCMSCCPKNAILYKNKKYPQYKENIDLIIG
ncbi:EFR1 family ferrodoxin [Clostridium sp. DSM 100503]|uniref:EFR1 family ferrodoxin n=1 Tax=Clostridium sp. DSM 100503 TaxID=2963282 RepID=UPI00214A7ED0|nr:EFR1 family ferrodoxin [Clostridium sp. DSM 100503]MCR1949590.1 EFR1 family ferrodoxin [Clostridium sp. DSM 100503]